MDLLYYVILVRTVQGTYDGVEVLNSHLLGHEAYGELPYRDKVCAGSLWPSTPVDVYNSSSWYFLQKYALPQEALTTTQWMAESSIQFGSLDCLPKFPDFNQWILSVTMRSAILVHRTHRHQASTAQFAGPFAFERSWGWSQLRTDFSLVTQINAGTVLSKLSPGNFLPPFCT